MNPTPLLQFMHAAQGASIDRIGIYFIAGGVALVSSLSGQVERVETSFRSQPIEVVQPTTRLSIQPYAQAGVAPRPLFSLREFLPTSTEWDLRVGAQDQLEALYLQFRGATHQVVSVTANGTSEVNLSQTDCLRSLSFVRGAPERVGTMFGAVSCFRHSGVSLVRKDAAGHYFSTTALSGALSARIVYAGERFFVYYKKRRDGVVNAWHESPGQLYMAQLDSEFRVVEERAPPLGDQVIYEFAVDTLADGQVVLFATTPGSALLAVQKLWTDQKQILAQAPANLGRPAILAHERHVYMAALEPPKDKPRIQTAVYPLPERLLF